LTALSALSAVQAAEAMVYAFMPFRFWLKLNKCQQETDYRQYPSTERQT